MKTKTSLTLKILIPVWVMLGILGWNLFAQNDETSADATPDTAQVVEDLKFDHDAQAQLEWAALSQYEKELACEVWVNVGRKDQQAFVEMMTTGKNRMPIALAVSKIVILIEECE